MNKIKQYIKEFTETIDLIEYPEFDVIDIDNIKGLLKLAKFYETGVKDILGNEICKGDNLIVCNGSINGIKAIRKAYEVKYTLNKGFNLPFFCWNDRGQKIMNSTHYCFVETHKKYYYLKLIEKDIIPRIYYYSSKGAVKFKKAFFTSNLEKLKDIAEKETEYMTEICELETNKTL